MICLVLKYTVRISDKGQSSIRGIHLGPCRDATLDLLTKALLNMLRYQTKIIEAVVEKAGKVLLVMPRVHSVFAQSAKTRNSGRSLPARARSQAKG